MDDYEHERAIRAWGETSRPILTRHGRPPQSQFWNHWDLVGNVPCCVRALMVSPQGQEFRKMICGDEDCIVRFSIAGGSDAPHFRLTLKHKPSEQTASLCFMAWTRDQPPEAASRVASNYHGPADGGPHSFGMHLIDATWAEIELPLVPHEIRESRAWRVTENTKPFKFSWKCRQEPIGINLQVDTSEMSQAAKDNFMWFQRFRKGFNFSLFANRDFKLLDAWRFFVSQPVPTPPSWWRYSLKTVANQHIIDRLPDLDEGSDLYTYHRSSEKKNRIAPVKRFTQYLEERHYETFMVGALRREAAGQDSVYDDHWNKSYEYDLADVSDVSPNHTAVGTYFIELKIPKVFVGSRHLHVMTRRSANRPQCSTTVKFEAGKSYTQEEDDEAPSLPAVGTSVSITGKQESFSGTVLSVIDDQTLLIQACRVRGTRNLILTGRFDRFEFGHSGAPFKTAQKLIQRVIVDNTPMNWLKTLLLGHNNNTMKLTNPSYLRPWPTWLPQLNEMQELAFNRAMQVSGSMDDIITMMQGPPGTGKTKVIVNVILKCLHDNMKWALTAETHYAVEVVCDRILKTLQAAGLSTEGIYLVEHAGLQQTDYEVSEVAEGSQMAPSFDESLSAISRSRIVDQIAKHTEERPFSLAGHVTRRASLDRDDQSIKPDERPVLDKLIAAQKIMAEHFNESIDDDDDDDRNESDEDNRVYKKKCKTFDRAWFEAQEYYIKGARGVFVTAATAITPVLRSYRPKFIIIDEASQVAEYNIVPVLVRFFSQLRKVFIVGDESQRAPFVLDLKSEFGRTAMYSLMSRLRETGVPITELKIQYRMHPHIAETVSKLFYESKLINGPNVEFRPENKIWHHFQQWTIPGYGRRHSVFIYIPAITLYRQKKSFSRMNPKSIWLVNHFVESLRASRATEIAILTPYKGQLRFHQKLNDIFPEVILATVDSAQGKEYDFVILDLVTPGGQQHSLGFLTDPKRANVALSRAKIGLLIIGDQYMANVKYPSAGSRNWGTIIDGHRAENAIYEMDVRRGYLEELENRLGIPGKTFEVEPRMDA